MKKLLLGLTLLSSFSSFAASIKIPEFTVKLIKGNEEANLSKVRINLNLECKTNKHFTLYLGQRKDCDFNTKSLKRTDSVDGDTRSIWISGGTFKRNIPFGNVSLSWRLTINDKVYSVKDTEKPFYVTALPRFKQPFQIKGQVDVMGGLHEISNRERDQIARVGNNFSVLYKFNDDQVSIENNQGYYNRTNKSKNKGYDYQYGSFIDDEEVNGQAVAVAFSNHHQYTQQAITQEEIRYVTIGIQAEADVRSVHKTLKSNLKTKRIDNMMSVQDLTELFEDVIFDFSLEL